MVVNPYAPHEQLHYDFSIVDNAQNNERRTDAIRALEKRAGCLDDALAYYEGVDPTHEIDNAVFKDMSLDERYKEMITRFTVGMHAAEILITSVFQPELYARRDSRRVRELTKDHEWYKLFSPKSHGTTTPYDTISQMLISLGEAPLSTEALTQLSMGGEMISSSLTWLQHSMIMYYDVNPEGYMNDTLVSTINDHFQTNTLTSSFAVQAAVTREAIEKSEHVSPEEKLERTLLGLKAQWRSAAIFLHPTIRNKNPEVAVETLTAMVESLSDTFIKRDMLNTKQYPKNVIKGMLHELLWMLDAFMIMLARPEEYPTTHLSPSGARLDRPVIGRPTAIRGIDFAMADTDDREKYQLINLKSGNGNTRDYHPRIKIVNEGNFQGWQKGRLINKLAHYSKILESNFTHPDTQSVLAQYALRTVQTELELYRQISDS